MATVSGSFATSHQDMIHDVQPDFYGKRVATCSSDRTIRIFQVTSNADGGGEGGVSDGGAQQQQQQVEQDSAVPLAELKGHEGPVWQVSWAHPKFGSVLASCSYDQRVMIWQESPGNNWTCVYAYDGHTGSVNSVAWAPHEHGLMLATASSDGTIAILSQQSGTVADAAGWSAQVIPDAHKVGVNAVSWAPGLAAGALVHGTDAAATTDAGAKAVPRLVSGGCDHEVHVWALTPAAASAGADAEGSAADAAAGAGDAAAGAAAAAPTWTREATLSHHTDWVRDVAWAPNLGVPRNSIASGGQDNTVVIWTQAAGGDEWKKVLLPKFDDTVWRTSWSLTGNLLAVSSGADSVTLWKEVADGTWESVSAGAAGAADL